MKHTLLKIAVLTLLGTAVMTLPAAARDDAATNAPTAKPAKSTDAKFYGPVTAVDTNAMTFTVGDATYTVTSESKLTKADKPATLADAVVGEPARGSYVKASDGKLDITKVRFGKKTGGKSGSKKKKDDGTNAPVPAN
jgi:hypothetical protein